MARASVDVVVVGSGPNGLAAAVTMARAGLGVQVVEAQPSIGGGARTLDLGLTDVGLEHDVCSAVHPLALASPFLAEFDVPARGVEIVVPELSYAQPLDGARAGLAWHDLERTVAELPRGEGADWRRLLEPLVRHAEAVIELSLSDKRSVPASLLTPRGIAGSVAFGRAVLGQGTRAWDRALPGETSAALLTGVGAHAIARMPSLASAGTAIMLATLAHTVGWGLPVGGSQAIIDALVRDLRAHGGTVQADTPITHWSQLPRARAYLFDTTPRALVDIWGDRMPARAARALGRFKYGAAAAKVDFVLSEPVPWAVAEIGRTGTVHVGGTRAQMALAEAEINAGRHASAPMVLASEPAQVVASRRVGGLAPLWTYAHVPAGSTRDMTEDITRRLEQFAPGFRDVVVASRCIPAARMHEHNANYIGGDIAAGAIDIAAMVARPTPWLNPYSGAIPGVYLCSSSTPPAPGVHGMNGWHAARRALSQRFGIRRMPSLAPGS
ncbi:NAD(P)/FAD-dependent oxidoreductase [Pseudactinotalea sp. HY158]|uniref:phytoene desaturase family protein n=1 Tax=Pseudactinotalea sp. HY158 TaxID=2654547 RepID=UPI00129D04C3|nr:NAD(P)/FAD-dependent oxidoreductase [Pseudactinotalea sp. HY158]QGH68448.1 FAD-dependent oxidoreductase [Pseudactinotalea sp. HY158]